MPKPSSLVYEVAMEQLREILLVLIAFQDSSLPILYVIPFILIFSILILTPVIVIHFIIITIRLIVTYVYLRCNILSEDLKESSGTSIIMEEDIAVPQRLTSKFSPIKPSTYQSMEDNDLSSIILSMESNISCLQNTNEYTSKELHDTITKLKLKEADITKLKETILSLEESRINYLTDAEKNLLRIDDLQSQLDKQSNEIIQNQNEDRFQLLIKIEELELLNKNVNEKIFISEEQAIQHELIICNLEIELNSLKEELSHQSIHYETCITSLENELNVLRCQSSQYIPQSILHKSNDNGIDNDDEPQVESVIHYESPIAPQPSLDENHLCGSSRNNQHHRQSITISPAAESSHIVLSFSSDQIEYDDLNDNSLHINNLEIQSAQLQNDYCELQQKYSSDIEELQANLSAERLSAVNLASDKFSIECELSTTNNKLTLLKSELAKYTNLSALNLKRKNEEINQMQVTIDSQKTFLDDLLEVNTKAVCQIDELKYAIQMSDGENKEKQYRLEEDKIELLKQIEALNQSIHDISNELKDVIASKESALQHICDQDKVTKDALEKVKLTEASYASLTQQLSNLEITLDERNKQLSESQNDFLILTSEAESKNKALAELQREIEQLNQSLSNAMSSASVTRLELYEKTEMIATLTSELDNLKISLKSLIEKNEHLKNKLSRQVASAKFSAKEFQDKISIAEAAQREAETKVISLTTDLKEYQSLFTSVQFAINSTEEEKTCLLLRVSELESELNLMITEANASKLRNSAQNESNMGKLLEELEDIKAQLQVAHHNHAESCREVSRTAEVLEETLNKLEILQTAHNTTCLALEDLQTQKIDLIYQLNDKTSTVERLNALTSTLYTDSLRLSESEGKCFRLEQDVATKESELMKLKEDLQEIRSSLEMATTTVKNLEMELDDKGKELFKLTTEMDKLNVKIPLIEDELLVAKTNSSLLQEKYSQLKTELSRRSVALKLISKDNNMQVAAAQLALRAAEAKIQTLNSELSEVQDRLADVSEKGQYAEEARTSLERDIDFLETELTKSIVAKVYESIYDDEGILKESDSHVIRFTAELEDAKTQLLAATDQLSLVRSESEWEIMAGKLEIKELQKKLSSLQDMQQKNVFIISDLESQKAIMESTLNEKNNSIDQLSSQILDLKSTLKAIESTREAQRSAFEEADLRIIQSERILQSLKESSSILDETHTLSAESADSTADLNHISQIDRLQQQIAGIRSEVESSNERYGHAKAELSRQSFSSKIALKDTQSRVLILQSSLKDRENEIEKLQEELVRSRESHKAFMVERDELTASYDEKYSLLKDNLWKLADEVNRVHGLVADEQNKRVDAESRLQQCQQQLEQMHANKEDDNSLTEKYESKVSELIVTLRQLEEEKEQTQLEVDVLRNELKSANRRYSIMKGELARQTVANRLATQLSNDSDPDPDDVSKGVESQISELNRTLESLRLEIEYMREDKDRIVSSALMTSEEQNRTILRLENDIEAETARVVDERLKREEMECKVSMLEGTILILNSELATMRQEVYNLRQSIYANNEGISKYITTLQEERDKLATDLNNLKGRDNSDEDVVRLAAEVSRCNDLISELSTTKASLQSELVAAKEETDALSVEHLIIKTELAEHVQLRRDSLNFENEKLGLEKAVEELRREVSDAVDRKFILEKQLQELHQSYGSELDKLKAHVEASTQDYQKLVKAYDSVVAEKAEYHGKYDAAVKEWLDAAERIVILEAKVESLNATFEVSSQEHVRRAELLEEELISSKHSLETVLREGTSPIRCFDDKTKQLEEATKLILELETSVNGAAAKYQKDLAECSRKYDQEVKDHRIASETILQLQSSLNKLTETKNTLDTRLQVTVKELQAVQSYAGTLQDQTKVLHETNEIAGAENLKTIKRLEQSLDTQRLLAEELLLAKEHAEEKVRSLQFEVAELKKRLISVESVRDSLLAVASEPIIDRDDAKVEVKATAKVIDLMLESSPEEVNVKAELLSLRNKNTTLTAELIKQVHAYKLTTKEHQESLDGLNELVSKVKMSASELGRARDEKQRQIEALETRISDLIEKNAVDLRIASDARSALELSLHQQRTSAANASQQIESLESNFQSQLIRNEDEKRELRDKLDEANKSISTFQSAINNLKFENSSLESRIQRLLETLSTGNDNLALHDTIDNLNSDILKLNKRILYLEEECNTLKEDRQFALQSILDRGNSSEELANVKTSETENQIASLLFRTEELELEMADKTTTYEEVIDSLKVEISSAQSTILNLQQSSAELKDQVSINTAQMIELRNSLREGQLNKANLEIEILSAREEIARMEMFLLTMIDRHKQIVESYLKDKSIPDAERKAMQSNLDELLLSPRDSKEDINKSVNSIVAFTEYLSKELSTLKHQIKSSDSAIEQNMVDIQTIVSAHNSTIAELRSKLQTLECDLEATREHENTLLLELKDVTHQCEKASTTLAQTSRALIEAQDELAVYQSRYSRVLENVEDIDASAILSRDNTTISHGSSIKQFPTIISDFKEDSDSLYPRSSFEINRNLPATSPMSIGTTYPQSPNKVSRRIRASMQGEESEITMPFSNASVIDIIAERRSSMSSGDQSVHSYGAKTPTLAINLLASIIKPKTKMLVLCDMSATMASGNRVKAQKKCVYSIANASVENNSCLTLSYWNSKLHWIGDSIQCGWRRGEDILLEFKALDYVTPDGGHDMRNALESAIRALPDATDIVVICHGITWPFEPLAVSASTHIVTNWMAFRRRNQSIKFHFIALGTSADKKALQRMAKDGDGCFVIVGNNPK